MSCAHDRARSFAHFLVQHRVAIVLLASVLAIFAGWRTVLTYSAIRSDLEELLPRSAPSVEALDNLRSRMPGLRHLGVVVDTGDAANVAAANRFLDDLAGKIQGYGPELVQATRTGIASERAFAETYLLQLMEPADVARLRESVEARRDWQVSRAMEMDLLDEDPPEIPIEELRQKYEGKHGKVRAFPEDRFVSADGTTAVLIVQASSHATGYESDDELLSRVQRDVTSLGFPDAYAPGMRLGYAGDIATRVEEMRGLVVDLSVSGAVVALLIVGLIVWFFRSSKALPILGIPLAFGTLYTFAIAALPPFSIHHLNSNTAFLGSIVVGNGINTGIILLARFREERWRSGPQEAIVTAVEQTWRPTLAAALAAAIAYGSLVITDFRGFNQFGWIGGIGMITCWGVTMLLAPPLISLLGCGISLPQGVADQEGLALRFAGGVLRRSRWMLAATAVLVIVATIGVVNRKADWLETNFANLRRSDSWVSGERYWGQRMDATLQRYLTPTVVMAPNGQTAEVIAERVRGLIDEGRAGGLIGSVRTAAQLLPAHRAQSIEEAKKLKRALTPKVLADLSPEDRKLVDRALSEPSLTPLEASLIPDVLAAGLRERDGSMDRNVLVFPRINAATWDADRMAEFTRDLRQAATVEDAQVPVAGALLLSSDIIDAMKKDGPRSTAFALGAVVVIAIVTFRSLKLSGAAVGSLGVGVLLMLGAMAWTGQRLNFSNFVALPITFGIAADYSINMLKRHQQDRGVNVRSSLGRTGGAVAMCSATTIIGFGSLLVAQNQALFSFGVFAVAGELACLATAVILLPSALWAGRDNAATVDAETSPAE